MLKAMENLLDAYNLRARLFPAFLVLTPIGLGVAVWFPIDHQLIGTLGSLGAMLGFATLLQQFARDAGKRKEIYLFELWGGRPSERLLSNTYSSLNYQTLARYHAKLRELCPKLWIPRDQEEELKNPTDTIFSFESCNDLLISKTRDKEKFGLLFEENMNYGFRRNLWGMKPLGLIAAFVGMAASSVRLAKDYQSGADASVVAALCGALCLLLFVLWLFVFKPNWVRNAAEAYARRLVACCDELEANAKKP